MINKTDLIKSISKSCGIKQEDVYSVIDGFERIVTNELRAGGRVQLTGFGSFEAAQRPARMGRNLFTGQPVEIAARTVVKFKVGTALKHAVN